MPIFNVTIDDISPLIIYDGLWGDSSHLDPEYADYFNGTFHASETYNSSATFTFNGTAIYLFGAYRDNHDLYATILDDEPAVLANGLARPDKFNQMLFGGSGLKDGQHRIVLQNRYSSTPAYTDVDYIVFTAGDGNSQTHSVDTAWDDSDPCITYSSEWTPAMADSYFQSTLHQTNSVGASATIVFQGNAISLYGGTALNHGMFSVSLDGGSPLVMNGTAPVTRTAVLLYYASSLNSDIHNLTITNVDTTGGYLDLDKVVVSDWSATGGAPTSVSSLPGPPATSGSPSSPRTSHNDSLGSSTKHTPVTAILCGVLGGLLGLGLIFILIFIFLRRRSRNLAPDENDVYRPDAYIIPRRPSSSFGGSITRTDDGRLPGSLPEYPHNTPGSVPPLCPLPAKVRREQELPMHFVRTVVSPPTYVSVIPAPASSSSGGSSSLGHLYCDTHVTCTSSPSAPSARADARKMVFLREKVTQLYSPHHF